MRHLSFLLKLNFIIKFDQTYRGTSTSFDFFPLNVREMCSLRTIFCNTENTFKSVRRIKQSLVKGSQSLMQIKARVHYQIHKTHNNEITLLLQLWKVTDLNLNGFILSSTYQMPFTKINQLNVMRYEPLYSRIIIVQEVLQLVNSMKNYTY